MKIFYQLDASIQSTVPVALTIGNFDGVHQGHQALLNQLKRVAKERHLNTVVLTFSNHPYTLLHPSHPHLQICTLEHKTSLLEECGIDQLINISFTHELSKLTAEEFLKYINLFFSIDHLQLGHDTVIGKQRTGNFEKLKELSRSMHFKLDDLNPLLVDDKIVSSSHIRRYIHSGELSAAARMLGRNYSIYIKVINKMRLDVKSGLPMTYVNLKDFNLCLPPCGFYAIFVKIGNKTYSGAANLTVSSILGKKIEPLIEIYMFDFKEDLYDQSVEIVFCPRIQHNKHFIYICQLKSQLSKIS